MAEEFDEVNDNKKSINPVFILGILFFPALIIGYVFYSLFRYGKQKLSFISFIAGIVTIIAAIAGFITLKQFDTFLTPPAIVTIYLLVCIIAGSWGGVFYTRRELQYLEDNPHLLKAPNTWHYKLKLKKTPWEKKAIKKTIAELKNGSLVEEDRAPLGIEIEIGETNKKSLKKKDDFLYETNDVVYRFDNEAVKHTLAVGASGSGKTITLLSLIRKNILMHQPVIIIDMKRSAELASKVANWTKEAGGEFYHFVNGEPDTYDVKDSPGQVLYDPLSGGTPTSNADMILGMREYDSASAHYKTNMQQVLQILFKMIFFGQQKMTKEVQRQRKAQEILTTNLPQDPKQIKQLQAYANGSDMLKRVQKGIDWNGGGLYLLASVLKPENLVNLVEYVKDTEVGIDATEMLEMTKERQTNPIKHSLQELQGQLRTITSSEYGKWLKTDKDKRSLNLFELSQKPGSVVLFSLNSDSEPEFAKFVGSIILSDITNVSAKRRNKGLKNMVNVYVDEFQAVPPTSVTSLLEKSRESRMAMTLAQQSFDQIISSAPSNGHAYLGSILDTCSNFIIHAGSTEPSAEILAGIIGKEPKINYVFSSNKASKKKKKLRDDHPFRSEESMEWVFDPSEFMGLMMPDSSNGYKSTAVIINKMSSDEKFAGRKGAVARKVWMIPDNRVLDDYYMPTFSDNVSTSTEETDSHFGFLEEHALKEPILEDDQGQMVIADTTVIKTEMEDEDGGFGFETVDESESIPSIYEEARDYDTDSYEIDNYDTDVDDVIFSNDAPITEETSAASMFKSGFKPQTRKETPQKKNPVQQQQKEINIMPESNSDGGVAGFVLPDLD